MQQKKEKEKKKRKDLYQKNLQTVYIILKLKAIITVNNTTFNLQSFWFYHIFLCWNADAGTCQKRSFMHHFLAYYQTGL